MLLTSPLSSIGAFKGGASAMFLPPSTPTELSKKFYSLRFGLDAYSFRSTTPPKDPPVIG